MKKLTKILTTRVFIVGFLILVQAAVFVVGLHFLMGSFVYLQTILDVVSLLVVFYLMNKTDVNPSYKLAWITPILLFPVFGGLFYLLLGLQRTSKPLWENTLKALQDTKHLLPQENAILNEIRKENPSVYNQVHYIGKKQDNYDEAKIVPPFPIYKNTQTYYLSPGEDAFDHMVEALEKANHYILMEYFIIEEGVMWNTILEILERKVQEGVEVRLIYDDFGCLMKLPENYDEYLRKKGIHCRVFNPFRAHLFRTILMNNRDHRKITIVDGHTAFTGGVNLADEYINVTHPFGHWKDASIMLKGEAVWSLTIMFFRSWNITGKYEKINYERYRPYVYHGGGFTSDGYVQPYGDNPADGDFVGEMVYMNMISRANRYIYITTPYLVIDHELTTALILAAESGVDVRIITPYQYDKWYVHIVTQAYYPELIRAGVRIYEYTPGFIHSKTFISDDDTATIGTINLDYRSLYLHFECGVFLYKSRAVAQLKDDFLTMLSYCKEITIRDCTNTGIFKRLLQSILKIFAPLL